jgi:hypothetical protein
MSLEELADQIALNIQELRTQGLLEESETLLNLNYTARALEAPYLFDMVSGTVHRRDCKAIPATSRSALYAVWELHEGNEQSACPSCHPAADQQAALPVAGGADIFFGILSFVDQFSSILRERGTEYRQSEKGKALIGDLRSLFAGFDVTGEQTAPAAPFSAAPKEHLSKVVVKAVPRVPRRSHTQRAKMPVVS